MSSPTVAPSHHWMVSGGLALTGSALFITAFPPWNLGLVTGWLALLPLIIAVVSAPPTRAALLGWLFGFVANLGVFSWLFVVPGFHWYHFLLLDAYLSVYPALWSLIVARFLRSSWLTQMGVACAWVLLDYVRAHAGFLEFPWITLAQSQIDNAPLLQTARVFGEPAVTFLVVLGNLAIWKVLRDRSTPYAWSCVLPVFAAVFLGMYVLNMSNADVKSHLQVGALGTELPVGKDHSPDPQARFNALLKRFDQKLPHGVKLIALPESSVLNPKLFPKQFGELQQRAQHNHATVVTGVAEAPKFDHHPNHSLASPSKILNGAWIITPDGDAPQEYKKSRLIPFAEEAPLDEWISWPIWLIPPGPEVTRGPAPRSYAIPGGIHIGIMVCWESLFAEHARVLVNDGATVLLMLANEGWFADPAGAQHNLTARMRAAETHRSVIVASNMGPSLVIDPFGRVVASSSLNVGMHWAAAAVPVVTGLSPYTRMGDVFVLACGGFLLAMGYFRRLRTRDT